MIGRQIATVCTNAGESVYPSDEKSLHLANLENPGGHCSHNENDLDVLTF